ncbi:MAG: NAD(+) diphosphatase [Bacteroidales bacterium]|nr:NAD(+) diphosphatase [Bacteroidales bacterium]
MALLVEFDLAAAQAAYCFRGREVLVDAAGNAALESVPEFPAERVRCLDTLSGCAGVLLEAGAEAPAGHSFIPIPAYFFAHDDAENARAARLKGYAGWIDATRFCPYCGQPLHPHAVENALECPGCGRLHYPRIEPCIITLIRRGDEILLLRNARDTAGIYACLAGFVEMGETLEQALRREVREETALEVENIRYAGSQGWPFPDQLMVAFYADYKSGEIRIQESEIKDARWFRREALPPLPKPGSIAWRLINNRF